MKRNILIVLSVLFIVGVSIIGYTQATMDKPVNRAQQRQQHHLERERRRAERQAAYERYVDSIVIARNYQFSPQSMQQQPAGQVRLLNNSSFELSFWGREVDIFMPYIKGVTPPYYTVMLNYTLPGVSRYVAEQTQEGWLVTFSSSLFTGSDYNFSLEIYTASGSATLTIASPWYPDVQYVGSISSLN